MSLNLKEYQVLFAKFGAAFPEDPNAPRLTVQRADGSKAEVTERSLIRSLVFACARAISALEKESAVYAPALAMILKGGVVGVAPADAPAPVAEAAEEEDLPPFQAQTTGIMPSVPSMGRIVTTEAPQPYVPPAGNSAIVTTEAPQPYVPPAANGKGATP